MPSRSAVCIGTEIATRSALSNSEAIGASSEASTADDAVPRAFQLSPGRGDRKRLMAELVAGDQQLPRSSAKPTYGHFVRLGT